MADPNHVAIEEHRLVFMLPCKVGNTSIKAAIADTLGMSRDRLHAPEKWRYLSPGQVAELPRDWLVLGFIRHPYIRFLSAYREKIRDRGSLSLLGLPPNAPPPDVDAVAERLPQIRDQHWRSLTADLTHDGLLLPFRVFRTDYMPAAWKAAQRAVERHCGLDLAPIPHLNGTRPGGRLSDRAKALIRAHYAEDFERFGYRA